MPPPETGIPFTDASGFIVNPAWTEATPSLPITNNQVNPWREHPSALRQSPGYQDMHPTQPLLPTTTTYIPSTEYGHIEEAGESAESAYISKCQKRLDQLERKARRGNLMIKDLLEMVNLEGEIREEEEEIKEK